MASGWYQKGVKHLVSDVDFLADNIKIAFVVTGIGHYLVDLAANEFLSAIVAGDRPSLSANLATKTAENGELISDPAIFTAPTAGNHISALVMFKDTGNAATSPVLLYIDLTVGTLDFVTNGLDYEIDLTDNWGII